MRTPWLSCGLLIFGCLLIFAYRASRFAGIEPGIDQAAAGRLVQELHIDHFVPVQDPGVSFRRRLESDSASGLNRLSRYFVLTPHFILSTVSLAFFFLGTAAVGYHWSGLVVTSIAASVMTLGLTTAWSYWLAAHGQSNERSTTQSLACAGVTFVVGASCGYATLFSPWGVHNIGVLALVAASYVTAALLYDREVRKTAWIFAAVVQACAIYAHWTNIFLLPAATIVAIVLNRAWTLNSRFKVAVEYVAFVAVLAIPVIALLMTRPDDIMFAGYSSPPNSTTGSFAIVVRAAGWFLASERYFSLPGLAMGIFGVLALGVRRNIWMPATIIGAHWLVWTVMPGFTWNGSPTELRTYNYVLPFLWVGVGITFSVALYSVAPPARIAVAIGTAILLIMHLSAQLPFFGASEAVAGRLPQFNENYLCGQGGLRPIIRDVDARVPRGATLIASDYPTADEYFVLSQHRENLIALFTLWQRAQRNDLRLHLQESGYGVNCDSMYLLTRSRGEGTDTASMVETVFGAGGFDCGRDYRLSLLASYPAKQDCDPRGEMNLYRVAADGR